MRNSSTKCGKRKNEYCRIHNPEPTGFTESNRGMFIRKALMEVQQRQASGKKPLCVPEAEAVELQKQERLAVEAAKAHKEHAFRVADAEKHMNLKVNAKTGEKTISVFRAGVPTPPVERGVEKESYATADSFAPVGRQSRMDAVFASPTMHGVTAWVRGTSHVVQDWGVRELRVNPDEVYVYSVHAWERCSSRGSSQEDSAKYWESGSTLTQWMERLKTDPNLDPKEWELLLGVEDLKAVKPVGAERAARSSDSYHNGEIDPYVFRLLKELKK